MDGVDDGRPSPSAEVGEVVAGGVMSRLQHYATTEINKDLVTPAQNHFVACPLCYYLLLV